MRPSNASTRPIGRKSSTRTSSARSPKSARSPQTGCHATTRSGATTASAGCRPSPSCRGLRAPSRPSLHCPARGELAYRPGAGLASATTGAGDVTVTIIRAEGKGADHWVEVGSGHAPVANAVRSEEEIARSGAASPRAPATGSPVSLFFGHRAQDPPQDCGGQIASIGGTSNVTCLTLGPPVPNSLGGASKRKSGNSRRSAIRCQISLT